jgi:hypothetical protein
LKNSIDIVLVGAGPSSLSCSKILTEKNINHLIIDKMGRVGGRVGSLKESGYIFDIGFQVYNSSYIKTNSIINFNSLDFKYYKPGSMIYDDNRFYIISDPLRDLTKTFSTLFAKCANFVDKWRIFKLKRDLKNYSLKEDNSSDIETIAFLNSYGFSESFIDKFFKPFLSGIFLEKKLNTSSKFFKYVFSNFNAGYACLPLEGMQVIPDAISMKINENSFLLNKEVISIDLDSNSIILNNGDKFYYNKIVLSGDSFELIDKTYRKYNSTLNFYFSAKHLNIDGKYIQLFPNDSLINNISILTSISEKYSKNNDHLISITCNKQINKDDAVPLLIKKLSKFYNEDFKNFSFLKSFHIPKATIFHPVNFYKKTYKNLNNVYFSGDMDGIGSIENAVISGNNIANKILANNDN